MIRTIYIEKEIADHPRTARILRLFPAAARIECGRYGEVFNPTAQNFRLQKRRPALILAKKFGRRVLETPRGYGIGGNRNYYFSHMLNCIYDCRYCFLQGMYRSAHYVLFVNFEDFRSSLEEISGADPDEDIYFFSGYDCDSLAMEPMTGFVDFFLPWFASHPRAWLELRTKSVRIQSLLKRDPIPNAVVAFSLSPATVAARFESKTPTTERRIRAIEVLQNHGWKVGLRFDPVIYHHRFREDYRQLFSDVFSRLTPDLIHSVSLGSFRLPIDGYQMITRLFPDEPLFAGPLEENRGRVSYQTPIQRDLMSFCSEELRRYMPEDRLFTIA